MAVPENIDQLIGNMNEDELKEFLKKAREVNAARQKAKPPIVVHDTDVIRWTEYAGGGTKDGKKFNGVVEELLIRYRKMLEAKRPAAELEKFAGICDRVASGHIEAEAKKLELKTRGKRN